MPRKEKRVVPVFGQVDGGKKFPAGEAVIKPLSKKEFENKFGKSKFPRY